MREQMSKATVEALAAEVCTHLGTTWKPIATDLEHLAKIGNDQGHVILICTTWNGPGRLNISGQYPRGKGNDCYGRSSIPYGQALPSISVAQTKAAKLIAGDITRRLLPEYVEVFDKATARKSQHDAYERGQGAVLELIKPYARVNPEKFTFDTYSSEGGYINNGQAYDGHVNMDLRSVPIEKAIAILKLMNG